MPMACGCEWSRATICWQRSRSFASSHLIDSRKRCNVRGASPNRKAMASAVLRCRSDSWPRTYVPNNSRASRRLKQSANNSRNATSSLPNAAICLSVILTILRDWSSMTSYQRGGSSLFTPAAISPPVSLLKSTHETPWPCYHPAKWRCPTKQALDCQSGAIHCQSVAIALVVKSPRLPHPLLAGPVVVIRLEVHWLGLSGKPTLS